MHPYSIDSSEGKTVLFYLAAIAIIITWLFYSTLQRFNISIPWWIDAPSVLGFYEILFLLFDNYGWRWRIFRRIGLIRTPVVSGSWTGEVISSFDNAKKEVSAEISQTWTRIEICLETDASRSCSTGAFFAGSPPSGPILTYQYQNDPLSGAVSTMQIHHGTARLLIKDSKLSGDYYSGRGRQNNGSIALSKKRITSES